MKRKVSYSLEVSLVDDKRIIDFVMLGARENSRCFDLKGTVRVRRRIVMSKNPIPEGETGIIVEMRDPSLMTGDDPKFIGVKFLNHEHVFWLGVDDVYDERPPQGVFDFEENYFTADHNVVRPSRQSMKWRM